MYKFPDPFVGHLGKALKLGVALAMWAVASAVQAVSIVSVTSGPQDGGPDIDRITAPCCAGYGDFALHDHGYVPPHIPDPTRGVVTFIFDAPVIVTGMAMIQHANGLTLIEHLAGSHIGSLTSESTSFGNHGDATGSGVFAEFEQDQFNFSGTKAGSVHQFAILKTSLSDGYASYRWYLNFEAAAVPESATWAMSMAGLIVAAGLVRRRRTPVRQSR